MSIPGILRGQCTDNNDPQGLGRIKASCPGLWGGQAFSNWVWPCTPVGGSQPPAANQRVWLAFEAGDENFPVWIGVPFGAPVNVATGSVSPPPAVGSQPPQTGSFVGFPPNYEVPTGSKATAAVVFALEQLGLPYVWGGTGPSGWDCSGLMQGAYHAEGISIPRTTFEQYKVGTAVYSPWSTSTLQPGDLLFQTGSDGGSAGPGHVGMYIGAAYTYGTVDGHRVITSTIGYVINAPYTGLPVEIDPLSAWVPVITYARRIVN